MSAQHTPGLWCAQEWTRHAITTVLVDDPTAGVTRKRVIAECESEDDARLCAAAKELLAVAVCEQAYRDGPEIGWPVLRAHGWDESERDAQFVSRLRCAAIAKATGSAT